MLKPLGKPMAIGLAAIDIASIEKTVRPTAGQRVAFDQLKEISARAEEMVRTACPGTPPATPLARLAMIERRMDAMLTAVRMLRPALEAFYGMLTDEQKARFYAVRPAHDKSNRQCHDPD